MMIDLLRNPVYIGRPAFGKDGMGDFSTYRMTASGLPEVVATPWKKNRPIHERKRKPDQWVYSENSTLPATVELLVWQRVQAKLVTINGPKKPARGSLWLKRFMVCGHCGQPMRSVSDRGGRIGQQYFCKTWQDTLGETNPTGCRRHPVKHVLMERIIEEYLKEKHAGYELLMGGAEKPEILTNLEANLGGCRAQIAELHDRMRIFIEQMLPGAPPFLKDSAELLERCDRTDERTNKVTWEASEQDSLRRFGLDTLADIYEMFYDWRSSSLAEKIKGKQAELESMVDAFPKLTSALAIEVANNKMSALEAELIALKEQNEPLARQLDKLYDEIAFTKIRLIDARKVMAGKDDRKKTEALVGVIDRIVCYFRHTPGKGRQPTSVLERVEIIGATGDTSASYTPELFTESVGCPPPQKKQGTNHARHHRGNQGPQGPTRRHHSRPLLPGRRNPIPG